MSGKLFILVRVGVDPESIQGLPGIHPGWDTSPSQSITHSFSPGEPPENLELKIKMGKVSMLPTTPVF